MLLGIISDNESQIYIKLKETNEAKYISFTKVNKDGIVNLNNEQITQLLNSIFNTKKTYLENKDGYDIYLDENNLKRYYKNNKEDFNMFLNNGKDATVYLEKTNKKSKAFSFVLGGISSLLIITSQGVQALQYYNNKPDNILIMNDTTDDYKPVTLEQIKQYIYTSDGLSSDDKDILYNENFLKFVLENTDEIRKTYDFNERMKNISTQIYEESEFPGTLGYYVPGTNTIHLLDKNMEDIKLKKDTETHEFIHLTQTSLKYSYILEGTAEILSYEFYDCPNKTYIDTTKRVKTLMEIIGPDAVLNAVYSYDTSKFEKAIKENLEPEDATEFLQLMGYTNWSDTEELKNTNDKIYILLKKMIQKKYKDNKKELAIADTMMEEIIKNNAPGRIYFNKNKKEYYNEYSPTTPYKDIQNANYEETLFDSKMNPIRVQINNIYYSKDQFAEMMKKKDFDKFIYKFDAIDVYNNTLEEIKNSSIRPTRYGSMSINNNKIKIGDNTYTLEETLKLLEKCDNCVLKIYTENNKTIYMNWDEYKNNPFIIERQISGKAIYSATYDASFSYQSDYIQFCQTQKIKSPSIFRKFVFVGMGPTIEEYNTGRKIK